MGVMTTSTRRSRPRGLRDRLSGDGGFALIEVMVSAVLVVVLATATLNVIDKSGSASANTRMRGTATGLAQEDQDSMRVMSVDQLDQRDKTYTKTVDDINFSVRSTAQWVRDAGVARCDSSTDRVEYLKTTSYVTWPGHTADPVTLESYVSPGVEALSTGALMVKLHTDPGAGVPGVSVRLTNGQTAVTDNTGCALFTGLAAGTLGVSWDGTSGDYVDRNGIQTPSENVVIGAGQTAQVDRLWDKAGRAVVRWVDENGQGVVPTTAGTPAAPSGGIGAGVVNSLITKPTDATVLQTRMFDNQTASVAGNTPLDPYIVPITTAGTQTKVGELFPYTQAYTIYAGGCKANVPPVSYTPPQVRIPAGADSAQVDVLVPTATVGISNSPRNGTVSSIKLVNTDASRFCIDSLPLDTTRTPSPYVFHVPYGRYNVCIQKTYNSVNYTLNPPNTPVLTASQAGAVNGGTVNLDNRVIDDTKWVRNTTC
jgi:Tfp pilus assembly protein PilV